MRKSWHLDCYCDMSEDIRGSWKWHNCKKTFADVQPRWFCNGRYWMLVAFPIILWKFLDENNYADKNDKTKFEGKNGYYHIATLENVRV